MPYTAAVALVYGAVEARHFDDECLRDPRVRALTRRVKVETWEEADRRAPEAMLCRLAVLTGSGARHTAEVAYHRGHWKNPMTDAEIEAKFRSLAAPVLTPARTDRLLERLWRLDEVPDAGEILRLTLRRGDEP
jgi:2-methylcitrate dehydratase